jgi:hypothetical protein
MVSPTSAFVANGHDSTWVTVVGPAESGAGVMASPADVAGVRAWLETAVLLDARAVGLEPDPDEQAPTASTPRPTSTAARQDPVTPYGVKVGGAALTPTSAVPAYGARSCRIARAAR